MDERLWGDTQYQDELIRTYVPDAEELNLPHYELVAVALERDRAAAEALEADCSQLELERAVKVIRTPSLMLTPEMETVNERVKTILTELGF